MAGTISAIASSPTVGLTEQDYLVPTTGIYTVQVRFSIPHQAAGSSSDSSVTTGGSSLQVLIKLNNTTKLTLSAPTPTQPELSGSVQVSATAGDTIKVVPSSAAAVDNQLNAVKGIINIYAGQGG